MWIEERDILPFHFYSYKQPFTGSFRGLRYRIAMKEQKMPEDEAGQKPERFFSASAWKEPFAYEHTPAEEIEEREFPFDEEGYRQVLEWLNEKAAPYAGEE